MSSIDPGLENVENSEVLTDLSLGLFELRSEELISCLRMLGQLRQNEVGMPKEEEIRCLLVTLATVDFRLYITEPFLYPRSRTSPTSFSRAAAVLNQ